MKYLIIALFTLLNVQAATFKFKDGTSINGHIFHQNYSLGNVSPDGILLVVNGKFYIHSYPLKIKEKIIDHGNGTYTIEEELEPTPAPPVGGVNPYQLPQCVPARINFIHFSHETLNNLYKLYVARVNYHKYQLNRNPHNPHDLVSLTENKAIALSIYKAANTKSFKLNSQKLNSNWNMKVAREHTKNSPLVTWFGN